jgi:hypothetical protein
MQCQPRPRAHILGIPMISMEWVLSTVVDMPHLAVAGTSKQVPVA